MANNPVPSTDLKDMSENVKTIDVVLNSDDESTTTRTGKEVSTLAGWGKKFNDFITGITERVNSLLASVTAQADRAETAAGNSQTQANRATSEADRAEQAASSVGALVVHFGEIGCTVMATHTSPIHPGEVVLGSELHLVHLALEDGFVKPLFDPDDSITLVGKWEAFGLAHYDSAETFFFCTFRRVE